MPYRIYITKDEKSVPGHKPMKDRLTLLLGANVSGVVRSHTARVDFCLVEAVSIFFQGDGGDQGDTLEVMDEILTTARDLELEVKEDDIEELIMEHEDELTTEELQEILNEEHQVTQRNVSPSEQEKDERGPSPTSAIKDLLKKVEEENVDEKNEILKLIPESPIVI
ncbi:uncharacterized protein TNCT_63441 [Trichonephila clavata]|uniref:Uncharacterized protein n=1 Tax=Trichonephila clavata TaxID=2740835 RepID=A0A8X6HP26_TRICU|nr:uncharacterized protein TNCT_63441 [Trichonephila clavata]